MAVITYKSEESLREGIQADSVETYNSEEALNAADPSTGLVIAKGVKFTLIKGGNYNFIVSKGSYFTAVTGSNPPPGLDPEYLLLDPYSFSDLRTEEDITTKRQAIKDAVWPVDPYPTSDVIANKELSFVSDGTFDTSIYTGLDSAEKWTINYNKQFTMYFYKLVPTATRKNIAFIAAYGHTNSQTSNPNEDFSHQELLDKGYDVYISFMVVLGSNPNSTLPPFDTWNGHDAFKNEDTASFIGMSLFLEPFIILLNHLNSLATYNDIYMMGISGGGWTTHWISALETSISKSFPLASSVPQEMEIGVDPDITYDYEQGHYDSTSSELQAIYDAYSYVDLYLMATSGGRVQLMQTKILDECCFFGERYWILQSPIKDIATGWGGDWTHIFHPDPLSVRHEIDQPYMNAIFNKLGL